VPHAEFLTILQRSDVFVRTHLRDGVCTSVLEALQLGVPVVASEDGLRPRSVITYWPPQTPQLVEAVERVLHDLAKARMQVKAPAVNNHLERVVALLLAAAGTASVSDAGIRKLRNADLRRRSEGVSSVAIASTDDRHSPNVRNSW
jgi:glycosyltransferase involved in cell wall biosynthesis